MRRLTVSPTAGCGQRWGEELELPVEPDPVDLDLSRLQFTEPMLLVRLAALLDRHSRAGLPLVVRPPSSSDVANYMSRMNVNGSCLDGCALPLPSVRTRNRRDALIPVSRLPDADAVDRLAGELSDFLEANFTGPLAVLSDGVLTALQELCDNATSHGESPDGAYAAVQRYQQSRCVLAIGDLGIGIPRHIRRTHRDLGDDGVAIARATETGFTGTHDERGNGYQGLIRTLTRTQVPMACLRIWSARGRFELKYEDGRRVMRRGWHTEMFTAGTWISLELTTGR